MHLTSVALAFLIFTNVLATPINGPFAHGNVVALRRRSPNEHGTSASTPKRGDGSGNFKGTAKCKRATPNELLEALRTAVDSEHPLQPELEDCGVYHLTKKVDNEKVILKVIHSGTRDGDREVWANHNVKQLLHWGHTPNKALYYLFIKNMGIPLSETTFPKNEQQVQKLQREAEEFYSSQYGLTHDDHRVGLERPKNWVFRHVGGDKWRAELIDWEFFTK